MSENRKPTLSKKEQAARKQKIIRLVIVYTLLTFVALFIVTPFYWMILTSLKTAQLFLNWSKSSNKTV